MGKLRNRNRSKKGKPFPSSSDNKEGNGAPTPEEDEFSRVMSDIVEKLESTTVMEKLSALLLLSEMVDLKQIRTIIIEHEICKIVGPLLLDNDTEICLNAAGAIRNLTSCCDEEVIEALVEQDVLTPLLALLSKLSQTLEKPNISMDNSMEVDDTKKSKKKGTKESMDIDGVAKSTKKATKAETVEWEEKVDLACQVVSSLWNLCESCATVLKYVNNEGVMNVFIKFLDSNQFDISLSIVAAQFIHMLSEDNNFVIKYLIQQESLLVEGFQKKVDPKDLNGSALLLQVLYAGILANIQPNFFTNDAQTFDMLSQILSIDQRSVLNQLTSDLPKSTDRAGKDQIASVTNLISAQKLILEFITNLCSSGEEEESGAGSEGEGMEVDEEEEGEGVVEGGSKISPELQSRLSECHTVEVVLGKVELPAVNVCQVLAGEDDYKHLMEKLVKLQCTGFLCLNNLVSCMTVPVDTLFVQFVNVLCHHYTGDLSEDQSESISCALRSLVLSLDSSLQGAPPAPHHPILVALQGGSLRHLSEVPPEQRVDFLSRRLIGKLTGQLEDGSVKNGGGGSKTGGGKDETEVPLRVKETLVKVVATWMTILVRMKRPNSSEHDIFVTTKLLQLLDSTEDLSLLAETLDCLVDLFSDDDTDLLAKQVNLLGRLTANEPRLRSMIKSNKKTLDSAKLALVSTVQANLYAFIQYKRQRVANIK